MDHSIYAVIGGDKRYVALASMLARDGYKVLTAGMEKAADMIEGAGSTDAATAASMAHCVILPIPPTKDGSRLWAPLADGDIPLDDKLLRSLQNAVIFSGFPERLREISTSWRALDIRDYGRRESFLVRNAELTAEAALMLAIENMPRAVMGSCCLVTGYGRIGRFISRMLRDMGAEVTVAARKQSDIALAESSGMRAAAYAKLPKMAHRFDLAVNTADAQVIGESIIGGMHKDALIIDVASIPGGTDFESAGRHSIKAMHALGLPGKYSPMTAAKIIKDTVLAMTEEERN